MPIGIKNGAPDLNRVAHLRLCIVGTMVLLFWRAEFFSAVYSLAAPDVLPSMSIVHLMVDPSGALHSRAIKTLRKPRFISTVGERVGDLSKDNCGHAMNGVDPFWGINAELKPLRRKRNGTCQLAVHIAIAPLLNKTNDCIGSAAPWKNLTQF